MSTQTHLGGYKMGPIGNIKTNTNTCAPGGFKSMIPGTTWTQQMDVCKPGGFA